jgi:uncharacterized protein (TIGR01777 family)
VAVSAASGSGDTLNARDSHFKCSELFKFITGLDDDAASWYSDNLPAMISRILVSGVSGPIGAALLPTLKTRGYEITRLVRGAATGEEQISWNPGKPIAPEAVSGFDAVVHLAGESIVGRWTDEKKRKIRDSRVVGTCSLAQALAQAKEKPQVFVCSSAIGYYGDRGNEGLNEESAPGSGFLPDVCREWEAATSAAIDAGIRTVQMRTGIVLSPKGGALGKMLTPFKMGVGGEIGDGQQWMSWIDVQDMVGAIHHILKSDLLQGPVNMVAPKPVTNAEFTQTLASVLSRPAIFPVPAFVVKLAFGEMGETVLLGSQRVEPTQLVMSGYPFRFSSLRASLENILKH